MSPFSTQAKIAALTLTAVFMGAAGSAQAQSYDHVRNAAISGHNKAKVQGSVKDCMSACNSRSDFVCKSFDYNKQSQSCDLSDKNRSAVSLKTDYANNPYDYYEKRGASGDANANMPDLSTVWDSSFGPIYWLGGYYGSQDKTLKGTINKENGAWVFRGKWGRMDARAGITGQKPVEFTFSGDGKSFTGKYVNTAGNWANWTGNYKAGAPYSLGSTQPIGGPNQQYNGELAFKIKANQSTAGIQHETYGAEVAPTTRCTEEMISYFKRQSLTNSSIYKLCRP